MWLVGCPQRREAWGMEGVTANGFYYWWILYEGKETSANARHSLSIPLCSP